MATKKQPEVVARRVWRMTADSPMGEYLELVPKESQDEAPAAPKRTFHPETPPSYTAVATPPLTSEDRPSVPPAPITRQASAPQPALAPQASTPEPAPQQTSKVKILRPAQVESWQSSSFDLLTGCLVRDVTDTIPGKVFDELFSHDFSTLRHPGPRRRR